MNSKKQVAALYCRISRDDANFGDSASIETQKSMLSRYAEENGFEYEFYIDDGYSGTNYDRPAFNRMIADIEDRKIKIVITKDAYVKNRLKFFEDFLNGVTTVFNCQTIYSVLFYVDGTLLSFYETE